VVEEAEGGRVHVLMLRFVPIRQIVDRGMEMKVMAGMDPASLLVTLGAEALVVVVAIIFVVVGLVLLMLDLEEVPGNLGVPGEQVLTGVEQEEERPVLLTDSLV